MVNSCKHIIRWLRLLKGGGGRRRKRVSRGCTGNQLNPGVDGFGVCITVMHMKELAC